MTTTMTSSSRTWLYFIVITVCIFQQDATNCDYPGISGDETTRSGIIMDSDASFVATRQPAGRPRRTTSLCPPTTTTSSSTIVVPARITRDDDTTECNQRRPPPASIVFPDDQSSYYHRLDRPSSSNGMPSEEDEEVKERTAPGGRGHDVEEEEDDTTPWACPPTTKEGEPAATSSDGPIVSSGHHRHMTSPLALVEDTIVQNNNNLAKNHDSKRCPADIVLMTQDVTHLAKNPIAVIGQDEKTVTFTISNPFGTAGDHSILDTPALFYQYAAAKTGATNCGVIMTSDQQPVEITAHCMTSPSRQSSLSILDVWSVDLGSTPYARTGFDDLDIDRDHDALPDQCFKNIPEMKEQQHGSILPNGALFLYSYKIYCKPQCTQPDAVLRESVVADHHDHERYTRTSSSKALNNHDLLKTHNEGHQVHCKASDYPCDTENGSMVQVCHYSTKDGYRTHCIPQSDSSSLIGYFWRDYCGPCVVEGEGE